jgi:hypothetical protein
MPMQCPNNHKETQRGVCTNRQVQFLVLMRGRKQVLVRRQRELDAEFEKHQMQVDEATG